MNVILLIDNICCFYLKNDNYRPRDFRRHVTFVFYLILVVLSAVDVARPAPNSSRRRSFLSSLKHFNRNNAAETDKRPSYDSQQDDAVIQASAYQLPPVKRNNSSANNFGFGFIPLAGDSSAAAQRICLELDAFRCVTAIDEQESECIELYLTCDRTINCVDGSDEWCDNGIENCACKSDETCDDETHECQPNDLTQPRRPPPARLGPWPATSDSESELLDDDTDDFAETTPSGAALTMTKNSTPLLLLSLSSFLASSFIVQRQKSQQTIYC